MFSSSPPPLYPGHDWEARLDLDGMQVWCDVILIEPTEKSAMVLVAVPHASPRWYTNAELRRKR